MISLLEKFLSDKDGLQSSELEQLYQFFTSETGKEEVGRWLQHMWEQPASAHRHIDFNELYQLIEQKMEKKPTRRVSAFRLFNRIAAILFIPLLVGTLFLVLKQKPVMILSDKLPVSILEYNAPPGTRTRIILPDSSRVWLNASSRLTITDDFGYGKRGVHLTGEAFFEVSKIENMPFIVSTPEIDITVLGTSFNVSAYPEDNILEAVLVTGHIEVSPKQPVRKVGGKFNMQPAQLMRIQKTQQQIEVKNDINTDLYTAWINNRLVFEDSPMEEVMLRLERWFNVQIELQGEPLKNYTFTGSFSNRTLNQILHYIAQSSPITYNIKEDLITIGIK